MRLAFVRELERDVPWAVSSDGQTGTPLTLLDPTLPRSFDGLLALEPGALAASGARFEDARECERRDFRSIRLGPAVPRPGKVLAIGRNYPGHAAEEGLEPPSAPLVFAKLSTSVCGAGDTIRWDASITHAVDYEAELAVIIGRRTRGVAPKDALDHVLGYTCANDVSARDLQATDGQWTRAKGLDTFCPLGPWIVTADEIADPQDLTIACEVNGESRQLAQTRDMLFGVAALIAYLSDQFTLEPGDVILTGTPSGVGAFRDPPTFLAYGDEVAVRIDRIGELRNPCGPAGGSAR